MQLLRSLLEISQRNHFGADQEVVQFRPVSQGKQPEDGISLGESIGTTQGKRKVYDSATLTDHGSWIEIIQPPRQFSIATSEVQQAMSGSTGVLKLQPEDVDYGPTVIKVTDQLAKDLFDFVGSHGGTGSTDQLDFSINNMHELAPPSIEFEFKGGTYHVSSDDLHDAVSKRHQSVHAAFMHKHGVDDTTLNLTDRVGKALVQFAKQNGLLEGAVSKVMERIVNVPDVTNGNKTAKIDYHTDLMQYRVRLYVDGEFESDSTHYEDSPKEALAVARKMTGLIK